MPGTPNAVGLLPFSTDGHDECPKCDPTAMGRMPAEGEALMEWMADDEDRWRASSFAEVVDPVGL
jgi:hypothetical protein